MKKKQWVSAVAMVALFAAASVRAESVNYQMVTVGDVGNPNDSNGLGAVAYEYAIGKYDVTIGQYTAFLNAVATTDTHGLYDASMGTNLNVAGISRAGTSGNYTYAVMVNGGSSANRPITFVDWFDSARFANWMANGQPSGAQSGATTENGAYALGGAVSGPAPGLNATNPNTLADPTFWIPTENEWYKSAYYQPAASGGPGDGYWTYATRSDSLPGNVIGSEANQVNWRAAWLFSVTQSNAEWGGQYYITDVGAFVGSASHYGTFDQTGNVMQWTDADRTNGFRLLRGSSWYDNPEVPFRLSSSYRIWAETSYAGSGTGFRLAGSSASSSVPEIDPSGLGSVLALLAGALGLLERRRPTKQKGASHQI
ncbi:MAG: SUMF1/EgtB/PvdO family nonheme iron enzyme [Planctomycetota bacterium]|nr:SUMF1/EgtB/PvdO family nonheme iron enzyme [Planctomycetota bacterium]